MAIEIEFVSVIVLKSWIAAHYPGGLDAYAESSPTRYLEDEHITRVGFMSTQEAEEWYDSLGVDSGSGALLYTGCEVPKWLECGAHEDRAAVWKASEPPGEFVGLEILMLRGMAKLLPQRGWMDGVIESVSALIVPPTLPPPFDGEDGVVACQRGLARVEFEVFQQMAILAHSLPNRRQFVALAGCCPTPYES